MYSIKTVCRLARWIPAMAITLASFPSVAADTYPSRPLRFVVPYAAGGAVDVAARMIGRHMSERLGQQVVVENKPGAGGIIAIKHVLGFPADGYTFLVCAAGEIVINPVINKEVDYDTTRDLTPVSMVTTAPNVLVVKRDFPANTVSELISYARKHPGELTFSSSGVGTIQHVTGEVFNKMAGIEVRHVPYSGAPQATMEVATGRVTMTYASPGSIRGFVDRGELKMLGMALPERYPPLPQVPTIREAPEMASFNIESWFGMFAASGTPEPVIQKVNALVQQAMQQPDIAKKLIDTAGVPMQTTPDQAEEFVGREIAKYKTLLKEADIRLQ
ncbi:MAG: tripartite tricarboxylate transporter substrate binding protein [Pigmentiphaga sp.]|uniref:Bug family tripartite tricarboxylate transporter substrate binding protein n=1 Tax=Pigmentiphaga sp. TaxID=1977564 RepID=UPI0029A81D86|nr:tripartite tricarboxylate transporter substrate binding protein [Pigmentiphaga sp.]MDX3906953.1 tripartite tricarboxylate transporter substrate binding protein [Pigmentiphaga sp.]